MRLSTCLAVAVAAACLPAQATRLTFDGPQSIGATSATGYGDRIVAAGPGVTLDGGATPNIVLNFVSLLANNPNFEVYTAGYHTLGHALGDNNFNVPGYVELIPDAGWDVVLERFDLGSWGASSYTNSRVRIADAADTTLLDTGLFTFPGSTMLSYPANPIRSSTALRVYINDFGDLGLDNFQFSQAAAVPEPGTWALWLAGMGVLGMLARRRRG
ncbi:MAG: PEP-CTERM sorting domain-containing protein [Aquabacterium sp.]|nr:PEP-CTERM sorting domain-containing protein [Aquabacterium sp.]